MRLQNFSVYNFHSSSGISHDSVLLTFVEPCTLKIKNGDIKIPSTRRPAHIPLSSRTKMYIALLLSTNVIFTVASK